VEDPRLKNIFQMVRPGAVEPGRRGRIINPGMIRTGVVNNFILNDLDARAMRELNQLAQFLERTKVFLNAVEVLRVVAMEPGARLAVFEFNLVRMIVVVIPGRQPNCGYAQVLQI
jgi:hypothetical protein